MPLSPDTLPRSENVVHVRVSEVVRGDLQERAHLQRLRGLNDPASWRAAVLALMTTPGSAADRHALNQLVPSPAHAAPIFDDVARLNPQRRLPWFEHFARALAPHHVALRHEVVGAARQLLTADGIVSSLDQLRWVALRHLLAGSAVAPPAPAPSEFEMLDHYEVHAVCVYCAFLSTLVPAPEIHFDPTAYGSVSQGWYDSVTAPWLDRIAVPARQGHDIDATLRALRDLQAMPWLLRPVLVRSWFDAARELTDGPALHPQAADALRLSCVLLDSPVPPELGRQYIEVDAERR